MVDAIALIDDLFFLAKVHETAKHTGVTLETAANGEQLLKAAAGSPAALILVDWNARQGAGCHRASLWGERLANVRGPRRVIAFLSHVRRFGGTGASGGVYGRDARSRFTAKLRKYCAERNREEQGECQ